MKLTFLALALAAGCTTVVEAPAPVHQPPPKVIVKPRALADRDIPVDIILRCDQLRMTTPETHRLCMLRGMDRYIGYDTEPYIAQFPKRDDIQIQAPPAPPPQPPSYQGGLLPCSVNPTPPCVAVIGPPYESSRQ